MGLDPVTGGLIGGGMQAVGGMVEGKKNRQLQRDQMSRQDAAVQQARADLDAWRGGLPIDQLIQQAQGPQTSTTNQSSSTSMNQLVMPEISKQFKPTVNMLQSKYTNRVNEADILPQGLLQGQYSQIAAGEAAGNRNIENIARERGVDPKVLMLGSPVARGAQGQRLDAMRAADELKYNRQGQAMGDLSQFAAAFGKGQSTKGSSTTSGTSTTSASPNVGDQLAIYNMTRPDVFIPQ